MPKENRHPAPLWSPSTIRAKALSPVSSKSFRICSSSKQRMLWSQRFEISLFPYQAVDGLIRLLAHTPPTKLSQERQPSASSPSTTRDRRFLRVTRNSFSRQASSNSRVQAMSGWLWTRMIRMRSSKEQEVSMELLDTSLCYGPPMETWRTRSAWRFGWMMRRRLSTIIWRRCLSVVAPSRSTRWSRWSAV